MTPDRLKEIKALCDAESLSQKEFDEVCNFIPELITEIERLKGNTNYLYAALDTTLCALKQVAPVQYRETIEVIETEIKGQRARDAIGGE